MELWAWFLLALTGADSFQVREAATAELATLRFDVYRPALARGCHAKDPEIRWRCRMVWEADIRLRYLSPGADGMLTPRPLSEVFWDELRILSRKLW
jgi:hypothetical protein